MAKWLINVLQGLDYVCPFLMLPLLVIQFPATAYIIGDSVSGNGIHYNRGGIDSFTHH